MLKISDIARHVGVSPTTVSLVLNEGPASARFSEKTRREIMRVAEDLGYRSNRMARAVRTGNSQMVGILGGKPSEEHVGRMLEGALEAADDHGYSLKLLRLHAIGNSAQQAIRSISELRLMGVVALHLPDAVLEELHAEAVKSDIPLVLMDTDRVNSTIPIVTSDIAGGFRASIDHLVKLGHSKIALINGGGRTTIGEVRREAFAAALERHGLKYDPKYCREGSFREVEPSVEAAHSLLSLPARRRPTAIVCSSDLMALATLKAAHAMSMNVPADVSVIGFANLKAAAFASPGLTTIEQPFDNIGHTAMNLLLNLVREHSEQQDLATAPLSNKFATADKTKILPTHLIERESTAPPASTV